MRFELHITRKALSEQAESLAEKAQLLSELTHHKERENWLEKRVPRWVRGLFGAK